MLVHRTISSVVLQRFVTVCVRTAHAESIESEDASSATASISDMTATNREGCVATCDFSNKKPHPKSYRHRNDGDYKRHASGHAGVMEYHKIRIIA